MTDAVSQGSAQRASPLDSEFLDERSATAIQWRDIWAEVRPCSVYGQRYKQTIQPFLGGMEEACARALEQLQADLDCIDAPHLHKLQHSLQTFPDISDVLLSLARTEKVLTQKQLLALKGFAFTGLELTHDRAVLGRNTHARWETLLAVFSATQTRSFSIDHVAGADYRHIAKQYAASQGALAVATSQRDATWLEWAGMRPNRQGLLLLPLPTHRVAALACKTRDDLRWLRDTPLESVFEVCPTAEMMQLADLVQTHKEALDALESVVLRQLTDALRGQLLLCRECLQEVTDIDWRLTKVALAQKWNATVPRLGDAVQVRDALHPLITGRLARQGVAYVPLTLVPEDGVNVLCGSNMGGKTVAMSLLSVCQVLTQFGMPVPAQHFQTRLVDCVRFCASAETDAVNGLSSFGTEMTRLAEVWHDVQGANGALICFDEPGRSTNPTEGEALVIGLMRALRSVPRPKHITLIATHFAAPVREEGVAKFRVRGVRTSGFTDGGPVARDGDIAERLHYLEQAMDYRVEVFDADMVSQEAITIAKWLGVPEAVLHESRQFLERGKRL